MKKTVQIVTIPLDKEGWSKDDLVKGPRGFCIIPYKQSLPNWKAQQLLVLSDDEIQENDYVLYSTEADNRLSNSTSLPILCKTISIKENKDSPNGKVYIGSTGLATIYVDKLSKIIAAYPHIEGTLPISKETVQNWIDSGTHEEGFYRIYGLETDMLHIDPKGNLKLEFPGEKLESTMTEAFIKIATSATGSAFVTPEFATIGKPSIPTQEEIELKSVIYRSNSVLWGDGDSAMCLENGYVDGYRQALKDLGHIK
jgi:hypothetical protein